MSVTHRTLLQLAFAAGVVILAATGAAYWMVYEASRQRDLRSLEIYVTERTKREEARIQQVEANLTLVRGQFLRRMEAPLPRNYQALWDARYRLYSDGAWRSREEFADGRKYPTLWMHRDAKLTPDLQTRILRAHDICEDALRGWVEAFPSLYFLFDGPANIGFDPRLPSWVWDTPADYAMENYDAFAASRTKRTAAQGLAWSAVHEETTAKVPMVSVFLALDTPEVDYGTVSHDLYIDEIFGNATASGLEGATHFIFRADGRLISHPRMRTEILASKGRLTVQESGRPELQSLFQAVTGATGTQTYGFDAVSDSYYSSALLRGPDWIFLTTIPRGTLRAQAFQSARWVLWSGLLSLALVMVFLPVILRRQIARPLAELNRATRQMSGGDTTARANVRRRDELGDLAAAFNEMAGRVAGRDAEMRRFNHALEERVAERTAALTEANQRLAEAGEEALRSLAREKELGAMKSRFVSTVSHEFRNPLAVILSCSDVLQRCEGELSSEQRTRQLTGIQDSVRRMADMMEEVLLLGRAEAGRLIFEPQGIDLAACCRRLVDQTLSATADRCPIVLRVDPLPAEAQADESLLGHIVSNLLTNAVKYSPEGSAVGFTVAAEGGEAVLRIEDHGPGIPAEDLPRLYEPFHRGSNVGSVAGTGLGLVIVKRCVEIHRGSISCESATGQGTIFVVRLPVFSASARIQP